MKQRRPDDVIRCSADADPMSKTIIGPMKLSVIGPMKHPSWARHRADEVVLVGISAILPPSKRDSRTRLEISIRDGSMHDVRSSVS